MAGFGGTGAVLRRDLMNEVESFHYFTSSRFVEYCTSDGLGNI